MKKELETKYQYNRMVGTVLYDYFFKGKRNANDAEFLEGYLKALKMEVQIANRMLNNLKDGESNINGVLYNKSIEDKK